LGISAIGKSFEVAATKAYNAVSKIAFDHMFFRRDIASRVLKEKPAYGRH
jgi:phosphoribosylamine-glycine ligase